MALFHLHPPLVRRRDRRRPPGGPRPCRAGNPRRGLHRPADGTSGHLRMHPATLVRGIRFRRWPRGGPCLGAAGRAPPPTASRRSLESRQPVGDGQKPMTIATTARGSEREHASIQENSSAACDRLTGHPFGTVQRPQGRGQASQAAILIQSEHKSHVNLTLCSRPAHGLLGIWP